MVEVEFAVGGEDVAGVAVEQAGFGAGAGEQQGVACAAGGVPVGEDDGVEVVGCVGDDDAAVVAVGGERGGDVAAAELVERGLFPLVLSGGG